MLHTVVSGLLAQLGFILLNKVFNEVKSAFLLLKLSLKIINFAELILHCVFHIVNPFSNCFHFFVNTHLKILNLIEISSACLHLNLKFRRSHFSIVKLTFFEFEVVTHFLHIAFARETRLTREILRHMF